MPRSFRYRRTDAGKRRKGRASCIEGELLVAYTSIDMKSAAPKRYSRYDLSEASRAIASLIGKCVKVQKRLRKGSAQATLMKNRLKAFRISAALIKSEMRKTPA